MRRALLIVTLMLLGALSAAAIALTLILVWMWNDARATGRNAWPWIIATLALGSFGPLVYLLTRKSTADGG